MVFDPSEFEGTRFDLYICKMLISIFSWFFHTILDPLGSTAFSLSRVGMYANHAQTNKQGFCLCMVILINLRGELLTRPCHHFGVVFKN